MKISAYIALCAALVLSACGFSPVYSSKEGAGSARARLEGVFVEAPHTREGQVFTRELLALLRGETSQPEDPAYRLEVKITEDELPLHIRRDRIVTRFRMHIDADYILRRMSDQTPIASGALTATGGYDRVDSDYSTHVSRRELKERLMKALAQDCRRRLAAALPAW